MAMLSRSTLWIAGVFAASMNLLAGQISVTSRASLGGNDAVDWSALGPDGTALGSPFGASSVNGLSLTVSGSTGDNGFERADQGGSLTANFAPGAHLLWTGFSLDPQTITIQFASPVFGAGTKVAADVLGEFTATLKSYDAIGNLLRSDVFNGTTTDRGDDSAIFLGVLSDVQNVSKLEISLQPLDNQGLLPAPGSFSINQLDVTRTVPEGGSLNLAFALAVFGMTAVRSWRSLALSQPLIPG